MWPFNTGDCLIEVTAYIFILITQYYILIYLYVFTSNLCIKIKYSIIDIDSSQLFCWPDTNLFILWNMH
jgi:hypothetical protein